MRLTGLQVSILKKALRPGRCIDLAKQARNVCRVVNQPLYRPAHSRHERQRRYSVAEGKRNLIEPGFVLARVCAHDPCLVRMLLDGPLPEADHGLSLPLGVDTRCSKSIADTSLVHEIGEEHLRGLT